MIVKESKRGGEILSSAKAVADLILSVLAMEADFDQEREHFWTIGLNAKNRSTVHRPGQPGKSDRQPDTFPVRRSDSQ